MECGSITNPSLGTSVSANLCKDVGDLDKLFSSILELLKGIVSSMKCYICYLVNFIITWSKDEIGVSLKTSTAVFLINLIIVLVFFALLQGWL